MLVFSRPRAYSVVMADEEQPWNRAPAVKEDENIPPEHPPVGMEPEAVYEWMARRQVQRLSIPRTTSFSRTEVVNAFTSAFELIGGVPRLALWAHENPGEFYRLYGKLLPSHTSGLFQGGGVVHVKHSIQPSALDGPIEDGEVVEESDNG